MLRRVPGSLFVKQQSLNSCVQVRRRIKVELKDSQNDVEIKNLPTYLQEDSIRVDGIGNATIFDVIYRMSNHIPS